jgi:hypothetical protein
MSIESAIEQRIREAIERGDFDDLPGKGKPIDLEAYFNTPEDLRMAYSILKSNNFFPEEVEIMKEIADLKVQIADAPDDATRERLTSRLNERTLTLRLLLDKRRRK